MTPFYFTNLDIRIHLRRNSFYYITFILSIIISIIIGVIIVISNESYLNLLVSSNKNLYSFINGKFSAMQIFKSVFFKFLYPILFVLILGMNFYLCIFSYLIVIYQFTIFFMTTFAVIQLYGISGVLTSFFIIVPVNLFFFCILIFVSVTSLERSKLAKNNRYFKEGYNSLYFIKIFFSIILLLAVSFVVAFIVPLILKSSIFSIF